MPTALPITHRTWTAPPSIFELLGVRFAEGDDGGAPAGGDSGQTDSGQSGDQQAQGDSTDGPDSKDGLPDDPAALKAEITRLRKENGTARTAAKTKAADDARNELVQSLGKALGLVKDGDDAPTPEQLAEQARTSTAAARTATVELAVYRAATKSGADPDALLDSRAFLAKVSDLDPGSGDFQSKVTAAITDAVKDNPKLKAARAAGASGVDHSAGGSGEKRTRITRSLEESIAAKLGA
ncbi:hypothetical protein [Enterococcus hirae]|uniref:hypothetical protein n=1 Tax=Enterococcus hirae TaxID=1354 RepID=UPI00136F40B1|nr:hypothetical protein [Enterococcus hirae]NAE18072.1 hypothetical protein [Enterococcus hirae]